MKVLVVDDSKAMQTIITKAMKSVGYMDDHYSYALDGAEALAIIRRERPDLVLCDMHMPNMTGLEMLTALRVEKDSTRVVIVSIDNGEKMSASIAAAGADAFLRKPFTGEQLFNTVTGLIGKTLTKKTHAKYDVRELMPSSPVIERVLGSLAGTDVRWTAARFEDVDFDCAPYYGGTFQDDQNHIVMAIFLDALAANTVATIISRRPLQEAVDATQAKSINEPAKQSLLAFQGVFSGLCKPSKSGQLLDIHAQHFVEDAHTHLSKHIGQYTKSLAVYSISCGPCQGGKIILLSP